MAGTFDEFANDEVVVVVVDLDAVSAPLYLADMTAASELLEHHVAPNAPTTTDTVDEAVRRYRESIVRLDTGAVISEQNCVISGAPELVVDGDIPADAVVDVQG